MTQSNLGTALGALGEREEGIESLEQAVVAFRAALEVRTKEEFPRQWAITQRNLARAEALLAERRGNRAVE